MRVIYAQIGPAVGSLMLGVRGDLLRRSMAGADVVDQLSCKEHFELCITFYTRLPVCVSCKSFLPPPRGGIGAPKNAFLKSSLKEQIHYLFVTYELTEIKSHFRMWTFR